MEYEKIKQLMEDMGNSQLSSIEIDFPDGTKVSIKKELTQICTNSTLNIPQTQVSETVEKISNFENIKKENINIIKSPMVGTVYLKSSPASEQYVQIGSTVNKGQTVCIVEAMKLMNEIESEFDGEICEIYAKDGEAVEYGTPLFGVK